LRGVLLALHLHVAVATGMLGQSDGKVGAATKAEKSEAWGAKRLKFDPWFVRFVAVLKCTAMKRTYSKSTNTLPPAGAKVFGSFIYFLMSIRPKKKTAAASNG
jgi:hypothetical protein